jgi:hypothetical protein
LGADLGKSGLAIGGFGNDGDVFLGVDQHHYAGSYQRLIIDYHDSDHADTLPAIPAALAGGKGSGGGDVAIRFLTG